MADLQIVLLLFAMKRNLCKVNALFCHHIGICYRNMMMLNSTSEVCRRNTAGRDTLQNLIHSVADEVVLRLQNL